ncbi:2'-5'-oligoadenylate synthase 1 [Ciona intestinalis]
MHTYECNRCGNKFGSPAAVRIHLRKVHFNKVLCDKCGTEIYSKELKTHTNIEHPFDEQLPIIYKQPPSIACRILRPRNSAEEKSFWEVPNSRISLFTSPGAITTCRMCNQVMGSVHGRERHERDIHSLTTQTKDSLSLRLQNWNILDFLKPCDVERYINQELKPKLSGSTECNDDVNLLVNFLLEELLLPVSHVIRGGSYGKGTCIRGHSDIDMVVFVENFSLVEGTALCSLNMVQFIEDLKKRLQNSLLATRVLMSDVTPLALRFQWKCVKNDHIHHVDVLPCNDLLGPSPTQEDKKAIYRRIENCKNSLQLQLYSAALLQLQVEFVRRKPAQLRDLMRLVKHWKQTSFGENSKINKFRRLPNSYTLELITVHVWENHGKPLQFKFLRAFASILEQLMKYEDLCVAWNENYSLKSLWVQQALTKHRPIILDPANPLNNVCASVNAWDEVAYVAQQSLAKPLFDGVRKNNAWR